MTVLIYILFLTLGIIIGIALNTAVRAKRSYSGTLRVIREENKVLYSLELDEDPNMLEYMPEVVFKVDTSDESSDRK